MSIGFAGIHQLLPAFRTIESLKDANILLLGVQDLMFTYEEAEAFLRAHNFPYRSVPPSLRQTTSGFGYVDASQWEAYKHFIHQDTFFAMIGLSKEQVKTLDYSDFEGADVIHDLNAPMAAPIGEFNLILNQGTLEHIFDIKQALFTLSELACVGGQVIHMAPAGFLNHGFYNFNATLFRDFYRQSHWTELECYYCLLPKEFSGADQSIYAKCDPDKIGIIPEDYYVNVYARFRKNSHSKNAVPIQGAYVEIFHKWDDKKRSPRVSVHTPDRDAKLEWFTAERLRRAEDKAERDFARLGGQVFRTRTPSSPPQESLDIEIAEIPLDPTRFQHEQGRLWFLDLSVVKIGDGIDDQQRSRLLLYEDENLIGPPHSIHEDIRQLGAGRYSHWGEKLYMSTSDGTSPLTNGRSYKVVIPRDCLSACEDDGSDG